MRRSIRAGVCRRAQTAVATVAAIAAALVYGRPVAAQASGDGLPPIVDSPQIFASQPSPYYFYRDVPGSNRYVGPIDVMLNKAFNMSQATNRSRRIFRTGYGVEHVTNSIFHPIRSIERSGGWGEFFETQILPIQAVKWVAAGFDWKAADNMTWYPNYMGHLVEGGITSRRLAEKLHAQGVPMPGLIASAVTMTAAMVNEAYTHPDLTEGTGATVADLYVFDLGGILLFSSDPVARFFSEKLHASIWTGQASLAYVGGELQLANNANNLVFKIPLWFTDDVSVFWRTAVGSHLGATLHLRGGYDLSIGGGADTSQQKIDPVTGHELVNIRPSASLWLDRDDSVLASLYWSTVDRRVFTANVFPDVILPGVGVWLAVTRDRSFELGLSHRAALGLGLGAGF
ncbi:MAG TPA: hypothetical protein VMM35_07640 [Longimicrobiales bacterium]|nr:hypothetical protein [Longimicrobiales bacterium]